jgi:hypothetical protein
MGTTRTEDEVSGVAFGSDEEPSRGRYRAVEKIVKIGALKSRGL